MSINVTVSGNPICIKRGRMVTADPTAAKQEFERRRKIRLEQVRQQSKQIAETVRNRVRKEKSKQQSNVEKQGEEKLKEWQARKLLELQNQYEESLKDFGHAHQEAEEVEKLEERLESKKQADDAMAKARGEIATQKLQAEKNERSLKKAVPVQQKKFAREVENFRSNAICELKNKKSPFKKKKKKNVVTAINISSVVEDSSVSSVDSEKRVYSVSKHSTLGDGSEPNSPVVMADVPESRHKEPNKCEDIPKPCKPMQCWDSSETDHSYPIETRISDRIKSRKIQNLEPHPPSPAVNALCALSQIYNKPSTSKTTPHALVCTKKPAKPSKPATCQVIPPKPTISIKETSKPNEPSVSSKKTQKTFESEVRSTKKVVPENVNVEVIPEKNIEILPPTEGSDVEFQKTSKQQDKAALIRGKKALEKERIAREYNELLKQLPVLQRQECLYGRRIDKPEYHMTEERLSELEKRRQLRLENAYKDVMRRCDLGPKEVKIPARTCPPRRPPFKVVDLSESKVNESYTLNVGTWGVEEDSEGNEEQKTSNLKVLLNKVKEHHRLMKENEELPENSNLDSILKDLSTEQTMELLKRAKKKHRQVTPPNSNASSCSSEISRRANERRQRQRKRTSETSSNPSPSKRARTKVIVLQNTSTQTTPTATVTKQTETEEVEVSFVRNRNDEGSKCDKSTSPMCVCKRLPEEKTHVCRKEKVVKGESKLCEIVIKIREDQSAPDIEINEVDEEAKLHKKAIEQRIKGKEAKKIVSPEKQSTWREQLSRNSEKDASTSTSYYSPPEARKVSKSVRKSGTEIIKNKLQQKNITDSSDSSSAELSKAALLKYVKKVLSMSRNSVDNLQVSTVSDISTPSGSVIDVASNKPEKYFLRQILSCLNITKKELQEQLSAAPQNTTDSNTNCTDTEQTTLTSYSTSIKKTSTDKSNGGNSTSKYEEITETCNRRILNLTAMIEQVRLEKDKMLQQSPSTTSEKDQSTSYMDIPQNKTSETEATEDSTMNLSKKIIEIDEDLVETLRGMSDSQVKEKFKMETTEEDDHIVTRFKKLCCVPEDSKDFVPLLRDIPKLPKLGTLGETSKAKRPPPAKGLLVAKRFNGDITAVPHELSTIAEAESQMSSRVHQSEGTSPESDKTSSPKHDKSPESKQSSESSSLPDILIESVRSAEEAPKETPRKQKKVQVTSSESSSELEGMESLLKEMGMGWAIATLRKTQEALAMSSSSSSMDLSAKRKDSSREEGSIGDLSLKELIAKLKASTSTNESSLSSFMRDIQDVSSILGSSGRKREEKTQRTSTPVLRDQGSSSQPASKEDRTKKDDKDIKFCSFKLE